MDDEPIVCIIEREHFFTRVGGVRFRLDTSSRSLGAERRHIFYESLSQERLSPGEPYTSSWLVRVLRRAGMATDFRTGFYGASERKKWYSLLCMGTGAVLLHAFGNVEDPDLFEYLAYGAAAGWIGYGTRGFLRAARAQRYIERALA